ncbi:MAG: helix-turn-helix domain-containing protein [Actinomycetota bacterium]
MDEPTTMGAYLRAARRKRRIGIERAAEETRIRADYLMRMESDEFDFLAPTYVRGFLKSYTRYLRVDPTPLLEEFDRRFGIARYEVQQIGALERQGRRNKAAAPRKMNSWVVASMMALTAIVALAVIGLAQGTGEDDEQPGTVAAETPAEEATPPTDEVQPSESPSEVEVALEGVEVEVVAANDDCWVFATEDGKAATPDGGMILAAGDTLTLNGNKKVFLRLGAPFAVELIVNGQNLGSPGGQDPVNLTFPDDLDTF